MHHNVLTKFLPVMIWSKLGTKTNTLFYIGNALVTIGKLVEINMWKF